MVNLEEERYIRMVSMNDIEKTRRFLSSPLLRRVFPILFILLYVIGMVLMLAFQRFDQGLILWFVSTVCGAILLYAKRKQEKKLEDLNTYLIKNFKLAFGNRIIKQTRDFVPVYIACGGTELEAVDFMVAKKVLRKFESLSLGFMKDQLTKFESYLDKLFGRNKMSICKEYMEYLKKNN